MQLDPHILKLNLMEHGELCRNRIIKEYRVSVIIWGET